MVAPCTSTARHSVGDSLLMRDSSRLDLSTSSRLLSLQKAYDVLEEHYLSLLLKCESAEHACKILQSGLPSVLQLELSYLRSHEGQIKEDLPEHSPCVFKRIEDMSISEVDANNRSENDPPVNHRVPNEKMQAAVESSSANMDYVNKNAELIKQIEALELQIKENADKFKATIKEKDKGSFQVLISESMDLAYILIDRDVEIDNLKDALEKFQRYECTFSESLKSISVYMRWLETSKQFYLTTELDSATNGQFSAFLQNKPYTS